ICAPGCAFESCDQPIDRTASAGIFVFVAATSAEPADWAASPSYDRNVRRFLKFFTFRIFSDEVKGDRQRSCRPFLLQKMFSENVAEQNFTVRIFPYEFLLAT